MKITTTIALFSFSLAAAEFPPIHNSEQDTEAAPPAPEEALAMLKLPEGFTATLFAAEPEVQNPIAMAWDSRGRMWVAENYTYAEKGVRLDLSMRDRILIFEDVDWDGKADKRTVFHDDLKSLTSVETGRGGVWAMCPPQLLFFPDADGDDVPDGPAEVLLDGFTIPDSNHHNFANGLRWGPDGWLYGRCGHSAPGTVGLPGTPAAERIPLEGGIWRYDPTRKVFEVVCHGTTNPWGHDWDENGELFFINTVNGHLWHGIHGAHFKESFGASPNPYVYERLDMHADHWHFDTGGAWQDSRDGAADKYGGGHAHIGMMIYQGDEWPERFQNRLFTLNMHGRRANVERLERHGSGYIARHEPDVFFTDDEWFRGIDIRQGPDGSAFILDWSDTGECHEHTGVHRTSGRIFRVSYGDSTGWQCPVGEDERGDLPMALRLASNPALQPTDVLDHPDQHVRKWAIRLLTDEMPIDTINGPRLSNLPKPLPDDYRDKLVSMAESDPSAAVRLTLASTLQRLSFSDRAAIATKLVAHASDADDHNLPAMIWYGISPLAKHDPDALIAIAEVCELPDTLRWITRSLASQIDETPDPLSQLLTLATDFPPAKQEFVIAGISEGLEGWRKATKPEAWGEFLASLPAGNETARELSVVFGDGRALDEIRAVALDPEADFAMRKAALTTLIENRPPDLREICETLLTDRTLNTTAIRGLALFDDPEIGVTLTKQYRRFKAKDRSSVIEVLTSRPAWSGELLKGIRQGRIPKSDLSAYQARQILAFENDFLDRTLSQVWGELRDSSAEKSEEIEKWKAYLTAETLAGADLPAGRALYAGICGACHIMYGEGGAVGPNLTGSGRSEIDYLLENILDPSAVVSADYQMSTLELSDGRTLTGVVAGETNQTLTLRQLTGEMALQKEEIATRTKSAASIMPEGLLQVFSEEQVRDLIAYLMHPTQVALP